MARFSYLRIFLCLYMRDVIESLLYSLLVKIYVELRFTKVTLIRNCIYRVAAIFPDQFQSFCNANEFFYSESLAAGSLDQLPAPLERIPADA